MRRGFVRLFRSFERNEAAQNRRDARTEMLSDLLEKKSVPELRKELEDMVTQGLFPPPKRFTYVMRRATQEPLSGANWPHSNLKEAELVFREGQKLYLGNNYLWAEMIACCTRCKDHTLAEKVFAEWKQMRTERDMDGGVIVIEAMIAHYTAMHDPQRVAGMYEELRLLGLVPTSYAASSLATSFAKFREFDKAVSIFKQPGNDSWLAANAVINYLCKSGKMDEALVVMNDSSKLGFAPNLETYNNLLRAAARSGEKHAVRVVLDRMISSDMPPNEQTYRMILIGLAFCPASTPISAKEVKEMLDHARRVAHGGLIDARTAGAAILAYLRCGNDVNNAVGILSKDLSARNLPVPFGVWDRLIEGYSTQFNSPVWRKKSNRAEAREGAMLKVFRWMRQSHLLDNSNAQTEYTRLRWRRCLVLLLSKLSVTDNIMSIVNEVLEQWPCFSTGFVTAEHSAVRVIVMQARLRDNNLDAALALWKEFVEIDSLASLLFSHVVAAAKRGDDRPGRRMIEFANENKLTVPRIESLIVHMKRAANVVQEKT